MNDMSIQERAARKLGEMTLDQLRKLGSEIALELERRQVGALEMARRQAREIAARVGMSLADLVASAGKKAIVVRPPPRYRSPDNPQDTWSGHGRHPDWLKEKLEGGTKLETLRIA